MGTGRARGGYAKGRERREAILAAANDVFATHGFRGASLSTIATRVGLTEPGLLHHFRSKEELLLELLAMREERDLERIARAFEDHATLHDVLVELCRQNAHSPGMVRLFTILAAEGVDDDHPAHGWFQARYRRLRRDVTAQVSEDQREGRMAADLDPEQVAVQVLALFDGLQIQWLLDPEGVDMVRTVEDFLEHLRP